MRVIQFLVVAVFLFGHAWAAEPPSSVKLLEVRKIWHQAPHNAFTDLVRFQNRWYCTFREGTGHAAGAGTIRILVSADGERWQSAALIEDKNVDLRDPKLSVTPDGRLMLVGGAAMPPSRNPVTDHYSFVAFSKDGKSWTPLHRVLDSWQWLWRITWHKGIAYGVAYQWDPKAPDNSAKYSAFLCKSRDGTKFEKVTDFQIPNATEASLAFDGDIMYCLQRRDGKPNSAMLGHSQPPYTDWTWKDLGVSYGGPHFIHLPNGSWITAGRMHRSGKAQTVLCRLDPEKGQLTPVVSLPSGGDTSYPGLVWHKNQLWVSYYSSHEGKSNIYLAKVQVDPR